MSFKNHFSKDTNDFPIITHSQSCVSSEDEQDLLESFLEEEALSEQELRECL